MLVKAETTFTGAVYMKQGEVKELPSGAVLTSLLRCGYVTEVRKEVITHKAERSNPRKRKTGAKS